MTWPEAFVTAVSYVCWTFIVWRAAHGVGKGFNWW